MHSLTDFKNFAGAKINLFEPLTILLGRNGSGKTNLIEGVELLAALANGTPFNEITDVGRGGTFEVRGGLRSCPRFGTQGFRLRFNRASVTFDGEKNQAVDYSIEIALHGRHEIRLSAEKLKIGNRVFFDANGSGGEILDTARYRGVGRFFPAMRILLLVMGQSSGYVAASGGNQVRRVCRSSLKAGSRQSSKAREAARALNRADEGTFLFRRSACPNAFFGSSGFER